MKTTYSPAEMIPLISEWGYMASYHHNGNGAADITAFDTNNVGFMWQIHLGDVAEDEQVKHMNFSMKLSLNPVHFPVGKICNDYNRSNLCGTAAYFEDETFGESDMTLTLSHDMCFIGGVSETWVSGQIARWQIALDRFEEIVETNEEPGIDEDSCH
jgi:hypothetical protein